MLQIIGWLGCIYLIFRALQMRFSREFEDDHGRFRDGANYLMMTAILIALVFAVWLLFQGSAHERPQMLSPDEAMAQELFECLRTSENPDDC